MPQKGTGRGLSVQGDLCPPHWELPAPERCGSLGSGPSDLEARTGHSRGRSGPRRVSRRLTEAEAKEPVVNEMAQPGRVLWPSLGPPTHSRQIGGS